MSINCKAGITFVKINGWRTQLCGSLEDPTFFDLPFTSYKINKYLKYAIIWKNVN